MGHGPEQSFCFRLGEWGDESVTHSVGDQSIQCVDGLSVGGSGPLWRQCLRQIAVLVAVQVVDGDGFSHAMADQQSLRYRASAT